MENQKSRLHLEHSGSFRGPIAELYETGAVIPVTGIYRVVHSAHRLPHEALIIQGQRFPKCQKCEDVVRFELIHSAGDLFSHITYSISEIPVIEEDEDTAA
jgi:hypothetical protein